MSDIIFQNITQQNTTGLVSSTTAPGFSIPCSYDAARTSPILPKADDYMLSIVRMVCPSGSIPLLIMTAQKPYILCLEVGNQIFSQTVTYVPTSSVNNGYVFDYQTFLNYVNTALAAATAAAVAAGAALLTESPHICYNATSGLFEFRVLKGVFSPEVALTGTIATSGTKIWLNDALATLFQTMPVYFAGLANNLTTGKCYNVLVNNCFNNSLDTTHYTVPQTSVTLSLWNVAKTLLVMTASMPIAPEWTASGIATSNGSPQQQILTDFSLVDQEASISTSYLTYNPSVYRFANLISSSALSNLNVTISWQDGQGNIFPVMMGIDTYFSIKFMFVKKNSPMADKLLSGSVKPQSLPGYR